MNQKYDEARPSIPAELRRQILVESGHCCAVVPCQNTILNIHHIDGNRENNSSGNLIALCGHHHDRAHDTGRARLTRQDLLAYKKNYSRPVTAPLRTSFVLAEESRRVALFAQRVRAALSWHDGEAIQSIDDQLGYWFPVQAYEGMLALLDDRRVYEVDMRSFDPEALAHQDAIIDGIQILVNDVAEKPYVRSGYCYTFRPGEKGSRGFDDRVKEQVARVNKISAAIVQHLSDLDAYTIRR